MDSVQAPEDEVQKEKLLHKDTSLADDSGAPVDPKSRAQGKCVHATCCILLAKLKQALFYVNLVTSDGACGEPYQRDTKVHLLCMELVSTADAGLLGASLGAACCDSFFADADGDRDANFSWPHTPARCPQLA